MQITDETGPSDAQTLIRDELNKHKMVVMAHRGGNWGADNSLNNFRKGLEAGIEGVETDIWLSKDGVPMVMHGGSDGQLKKYGLPDDYCFKWTCEELRTKFKIEDGTPMPTLEEFLAVFKDSSVILNIELKGPLTAEYKPQYDYGQAARVVHRMICDHGVSHQVMLSSFVPEII